LLHCSRRNITGLVQNGLAKTMDVVGAEADFVREAPNNGEEEASKQF